MKQIWERKRLSEEGQKADDAVLQNDAISENNVDEITNSTQKLRRPNKILMEQARDPILLQLNAKIQKVEYSEKILQQDIRYKHYLNNSDCIVLKDEVISRQYYDETGQVKYHQTLLPKHLLKELLLALYGTAHKYPGISKLLQELRKKFYYPGIAKHVKKWVEECKIYQGKTCPKQRNNARIAYFA